jgi:hypothetical protein
MAYEGPNPLPVPSGMTGNASFTANGIICGGITSTAAFQSAGTGTAGQLLTNNAGALPTWTGAGSLVLLNSQNASSSASIAFSSTYLTSTYNNYIVVLSNVQYSTSSSLELVFSTNNGSTYLASNYLGGTLYNQTSAGVAWGNLVATTYCYMDNIGTGQYNNFVIYLENFTSNLYPQVSGTSNRSGYMELLSCQNTANNIINNIKFLPAAGTITAGTFTLFGVLE